MLTLSPLPAMFCQTSMEAVIPALMDLYFRYDDMANSYLYLAAGLELLGKWESFPPSWISTSITVTWPAFMTFRLEMWKPPPTALLKTPKIRCAIFEYW